jgi:hypothetical protein
MGRYSNIETKYAPAANVIHAANAHACHGAIGAEGNAGGSITRGREGFLL